MNFDAEMRKIAKKRSGHNTGTYPRAWFAEGELAYRQSVNPLDGNTVEMVVEQTEFSNAVRYQNLACIYQWSHCRSYVSD